MKRYILLLLVGVLILACKNSANTIDTGNPSEIERVSILDTFSITQNPNGKWIANAETHLGFRKMDSIITKFRAENKTDYIELGNQLSEQTGFIIKHCSMKGEAHDQLHVILIPMLDEISVLKEENNNEKAKSALYNLEQLSSAYFKYFSI
ncbi:hypothetical protein [uncultured Psychroserpens sp.]|uniref:hypothetical protein n=1 Tax=uncultured Psychroserpens sp. TaxID=255436 RepID=UPI002627F233|nr:hypothetical protein [uncultured Psychroserpens sp.]